MSEEFDPTDPEERTIGDGLFEREMGPSSSMAHLYRGEVHRMKLWRERLDRTSNWAVTVMAAILTWSFSRGDNPHYLLLFGALAVAVFLVIEARRYRGYDMWRSRVRLLQENVWAHGLDPSDAPEDERWRERLSSDYRSPELKISMTEAVAHRLRRVYLYLFAILLGAWGFRVTMFTGAAWPTSAAVGMVPGIVVTAVVAAAMGSAVTLACWPRDWKAKGELREENVAAWEDA